MPGYMGTEDDDVYEGDAVLADYVGVYGGDDTVNTYGGHDNIVAGDGDNRVDAGDGNDTITAGDGEDWLDGGEGNDFIIDDGGSFVFWQWIFGGGGDDTIVIRNGGMTYLDGGSAMTPTSCIGPATSPKPGSACPMPASRSMTSAATTRSSSGRAGLASSWRRMSRT